MLDLDQPVNGRSHCPRCRTPMKRAELIPGMSHIQGGVFKCGRCGDLKMADVDGNSER
jgi:hypothetical protein